MKHYLKPDKYHVMIGSVFPAFNSFLKVCKEFECFYTVIGPGFYWRIEEVPYLYLPEEIYNAIYSGDS